mmetsp:Transcript_18910/g.30894  ORF Transcript_18910/g.30894 Transcript_18910/m.30894 type:complete len:172 (+) Transcript_18910:247-762(+)
MVLYQRSQQYHAKYRPSLNCTACPPKTNLFLPLLRERLNKLHYIVLALQERPELLRINVWDGTGTDWGRNDNNRGSYYLGCRGDGRLNFVKNEEAKVSAEDGSSNFIIDGHNSYFVVIFKEVTESEAIDESERGRIKIMNTTDQPMSKSRKNPPQRYPMHLFFTITSPPAQ